MSRRISVVGALGVVAAVIFVGILATGRESLGSVGGRFMSALAKGDVDTLTKMSYLGNEPEDQIRKEWDFAVNTAGKYYNFTFRITGSLQSNDKTGSVNMQLMRDATSAGSYEEVYELPLVKVGDDWKIDVKSISREMYPALPQ